jgi:DNA-binding NarL/FixJ family response regulator
MEAILERDQERTATARAIDDAARGDGGLLVLEGPAGIGKTALLRAARAQAEAPLSAAAAATVLEDALDAPPARGSAEELTPDEQRVVKLAADGLSEREIAETLWVAQRTVAEQLASARAKLS